MLFRCLRKRGKMEQECKKQGAAYSEHKDDSKAGEKTREKISQEREFWLSVKYSDEHRESER